MPNGVEQLIARCLAKSPDDRWQSAADLLDELRRIAGAVRSARESGWFRRFISEHRVAGIGVLVTLACCQRVPRRSCRRPTTPAVPLRPVATVQLAVLPLRMVGDAIRGDEYLGVGIADSIITRLAAIRSDRAPPDRGGHRLRQYSRRHGDRRQNARRRARAVWHHPAERRHVSHHPSACPKLGQCGDRGRGSYDVLRSELTKLQDTIAEEVVGALRLELTEAERARVRRRYTDNAEAYDLYLRGRASFVNYTEPGMKAAIGDFERALAIDPDYALARAGLAIASAWFSIRYAYETRGGRVGCTRRTRRQGRVGRRSITRRGDPRDGQRRRDAARRLQLASRDRGVPPVRWRSIRRWSSDTSCGCVRSTIWASSIAWRTRRGPPTS